MPTTLTLKNIPDAVYAKLKSAAALHRRSLNNEAIVCLETALSRANIAPGEHLVRARALRTDLHAEAFHAHGIDALKREGRK